MTPASSSLLHSRARDGHQRGFFVAMASILVVVVAVGFAPSFYLRTYLAAGSSGAARQSLPMHVYAHGVVLTLWYLLFLVQTILVASRRVSVHRRLGVVGAVLAAAVLTASMLVVIRLAARATAHGVTSGPVALIVTGDTGLLILFALFVVAGISSRRQADVHKRLMLLASITLVAPALARLPGAEALIPISVVVPQLLLFAALIGYDVVSSRRLHPATAWGVALYLVVAVTSTVAGFSEFGRAFVSALA
jgi:hypothetical protein